MIELISENQTKEYYLDWLDRAIKGDYTSGIYIVLVAIMRYFGNNFDEIIKAKYSNLIKFKQAVVFNLEEFSLHDDSSKYHDIFPITREDEQLLIDFFKRTEIDKFEFMEYLKDNY